MIDAERDAADGCWRERGFRLSIGGASPAWPGRALALVCSCAALALGLSGCGAGSPHAPGAPSSGITKKSSAPSASGRPTWVQGLGAGVSVIGPALTLPGHDSPGAAVRGFVNALNAGKAQQICSYFDPSAQATCRSQLGGAPAGSAGTFKNFALGYVAIDGSEALVGSTGTRCQPTPVCGSNHDPAAIFATGKPFAILWAESEAAATSSSNAYSLAPCVKVGTSWYLQGQTGSSGG